MCESACVRCVETAHWCKLQSDYNDLRDVSWSFHVSNFELPTAYVSKEASLQFLVTCTNSMGTSLHKQHGNQSSMSNSWLYLMQSESAKLFKSESKTCGFILQSALLVPFIKSVVVTCYSIGKLAKVVHLISP